MSERIRKRYEWELHHIRMGEPISTLPKHLISDIGELLDHIAELEMALENTAHNIKHCTPIAVCDGKCFRHECVCPTNELEALGDKI